MQTKQNYQFFLSSESFLKHLHVYILFNYPAVFNYQSTFVGEKNAEMNI